MTTETTPAIPPETAAVAYRVHVSIYATPLAVSPEAAHMAVQRALWDLRVDGEAVGWAFRSVRRLHRGKP